MWREIGRKYWRREGEARFRVNILPTKVHILKLVPLSHVTHDLWQARTMSIQTALFCPCGHQVGTGKVPWCILSSGLFNTWSFSQGQHSPHWMPPWSCMQDENDFLPWGSYTNLFLKLALIFKSHVYQTADCPASCLAAFSNNCEFVALGIFLKTDWVIRYMVQLHLVSYFPSKCSYRKTFSHAKNKE